VGHFASTDLSRYREMESYLRRCGRQPPNLENCASFEELKTRSSAQYVRKGLASLRSVPSDSVDFIWSHAVLEHVRREEFMPTLIELRRIQRPEGVSSHCISISDILGANLNDLRFNDRIWESSFMANSGLYTNRIRYAEMLRLFRQAGFEPEVRRVQRWTVLPTPRRKMVRQFATLPEDELRVSGFDVTLR
jgi:Methyltransferase domain